MSGQATCKVRDSTASSELVPPPASEIARRRGAILADGFPYIVATDSAGRLVGYAVTPMRRGIGCVRDTASRARIRTTFRHRLSDTAWAGYCSTR